MVVSTGSVRAAHQAYEPARYIVIHPDQWDETLEQLPEGDLLCDPLTGLVAYPSFEAHLVRAIPSLLDIGFHLAIGDVDGLKEYVSSRNMEDGSMFGHLAGNECMRRVGVATRAWGEELRQRYPFFVCGTFGGDEVIVAASGMTYPDFRDSIVRLACDIRVSAPRPCSFASGTFASLPQPDCFAPMDVYRMIVSRVDATLFRWKQDIHKLDNLVFDAGDIVSSPRRGSIGNGNGSGQTSDLRGKI